MIIVLVFVSLFSFISEARKDIGSNKDVKSVFSASFETIIDNNPIVLAIAEAGYTF